MSEASPVLARIRELLGAAGIAPREIRHAPTRTSEESARARGEPLEVGGKALLLRVDDAYGLYVLSAALRLDSAAILRRHGARRSRFATPAELARLTGLVPGSVPPFGAPILPFPLYADESIAAQPRIAFNAGSLTDSMVIPVPDWLRVARPEVFRFGRAADAEAAAG